MPQGPDSSIPINLDDQHVVRMRVSRNRRLRIDVGGWGLYENAVIVYLEDTLFPVVERGNYNRSSEVWISDPILEEGETYLISGWSKESRPDGGKPWRQNTVIIVPEGTRGYTTEMRFRDFGPLIDQGQGSLVQATISE
jgi:hypothetical protein